MHFQRAIALVGGQAPLARRLTEIMGEEITQQRIWNILNKAQRVPAELVIPLEKATNGIISRHDLRPDLYPIEPEGVPGGHSNEKDVGGSIDVAAQ